MAQFAAPEASPSRTGAVLALVLLGWGVASATDWPQYRGPATDGSSPDAIATTWTTNSPTFVVWKNTSLTNGFSSFAVSQGRAFAMISRVDGSGDLQESCAAVDAAMTLATNRRWNALVADIYILEMQKCDTHATAERQNARKKADLIELAICDKT
jgi:hypothetical protein